MKIGSFRELRIKKAKKKVCCAEKVEQQKDCLLDKD